MIKDLNTVSQDKLNNLIKSFDKVNHSIILTIPKNIDSNEIVEELIKGIEGNIDIPNSSDIFIGKPVSKQYRIRETSSSKRRMNEIFIEDILEWSLVAPKNLKYSWTLIYDFEKMSNNSDLLLKTIEEPQDNKVFLLVTSNSRQISQTIKSRCLNITLQSNNQKPNSNDYINLLTSIINNKSILLQFLYKDQLNEYILQKTNTELEKKGIEIQEMNLEDKVTLSKDEEKELLKNLYDEELRNFLFCLDNELIKNEMNPIKREYKDLIGTNINKDSLILMILETIREKIPNE